MLYARQYSYLRFVMWADALLAGIGLLLAYLVRYELALWCASNASGLPEWFPAVVPYEEGYFLKELIWTLPACMLVWPLCLGHCGFYVPDIQRDFKKKVSRLLRGSLLSTVVIVLLIFVFKLEYTARTVIVGTGFLAALLLWVKELILQRHPIFVREADDFHLLILKNQLPDEKVLLSYGNWGAKTVAELELEALKPEELTAVLISEKVDEVACFCEESDLARYWSLLDRAVKMGLKVACYFPSDGSPISLELEREEKLCVLSLNKSTVNFGALTLKLLLDRVLAFLLLILLAPVFLIIAVLIKRDSYGPVFWRQTRVGRNGHLFTLYKFRSMVSDAEEQKKFLQNENEVEGWAFKMENDPRVTPFGRFLRRYSLDELPQLWNVLKGDMSLIGPRPSLPEEVERFLPGERRRLAMKPGMTGLWQVSGRHRLPIERWIELDLEYIDRWSLGLDFQIFLKTFSAVWRGEGS